MHADLTARERLDMRAALTAAVADLCRDLDGLLECIDGDPVEVARDKAVREDVSGPADDDAVMCHVEVHDVERLRMRDAEAFALADRVERHALVMAEHMALLVDDIAWMQAGGILRAQVGLVVIMRHEADLLAVRLVGDGQLVALRHLARLHLRVVAERHQEVRERLLVEVVERIRLVLVGVDALLEHIAARLVLRDARIVARRDVIRAELHGLLQEPLELDVAVAGDAGIRRPALRVVREEVIDDLFLEHLLEVHGVMRDADDLRHAARIVDTAEAAAAAVVLVKITALLRQAHRHTDGLIVLLLEQRRRKRAVHAAAHRDDYFLFCHSVIVSFLVSRIYISARPIFVDFIL